MREDTNPAEDEAYRSLFRPADAVQPAKDREPADTGRLFRSNRAATATVAILAVGSDQVAKLRTLQVIDGEAKPVAPAPLAGLLPPTPSRSAPGVIAITPDAYSPAVVALDEPRGRKARRAFTNSASTTAARGLRPIGVYVVVIGATLLFGIVDIFVGGAGLGLVTGLALLIASGYAALTVRIGDLAVAVVAPPIAFFFAAITVGQIGVTITGGAIIGRAVVLFFTLADNWLWVIGSTLIALVIVIVRANRR
ncbi:MAG: hypothetical protein O2943_05420 [Actinomycetota bacterium]|nr:hypothetical protein [Actinomycetota bacterium]